MSNYHKGRSNIMFTPKTLEFIAENHWRGDKEWFAAHKSEYKKFVQDPLTGLSNTLAPTVESIDGALITDPRSTVSRIYRDMRFAKGGSPYREMLWISFRHDKKAYPCSPEFYFVFSPRKLFYGCGYYSAKADSMAEVRKLIVGGHKKFQAARAVLEENSDFALDGDMYKKSRHSEYPPELQNWLDRKTVCCSCRPPIEQLFSADLAENVRSAFIRMKPVYDLLMYAEKCAAEKI